MLSTRTGTVRGGGLKRKWAELERVEVLVQVDRQMSPIPYIVGVLETTP